MYALVKFPQFASNSFGFERFKEFVIQDDQKIINKIFNLWC